jgi:hypothetical protein
MALNYDFEDSKTYLNWWKSHSIHVDICSTCHELFILDQWLIQSHCIAANRCIGQCHTPECQWTHASEDGK